MTQTDDLLTHEHAGTPTLSASVLTEHSQVSVEQAPPARKAGGLAAMTLSELQGVAAGLGINGTARLRKGQLISAIQTARGESPAEPRPVERTDASPANEAAT